MRSVCVYCGSSTGTRSIYTRAASTMGEAIAGAGLCLVYGGARVGLMGVLADSALAAGARVIGVMPRLLTEREVAHPGLTELEVVANMHQRKASMAHRSDAFVALPGGMGTLEELFEMLTWGQLGLHRKPCGLLNTAGYYDSLLAFIEHMTDQGFLRQEQREQLEVASSAQRLLSSLGYNVNRVTASY